MPRIYVLTFGEVLLVFKPVRVRMICVSDVHVRARLACGCVPVYTSLSAGKCTVLRVFLRVFRCCNSSRNVQCGTVSNANYRLRHLIRNR
jgi:hypothetical protein